MSSSGGRVSRFGRRRRRARHRRLDRLLEQVHRRQHLVLRILLRDRPLAKSTRVPPMTTTTSTAVMPAYDRSGPRRQRRWPVTAHETSSATDQRVHRRHERPHPRVDDARREKQLKRIGGNPEQVEEKRHGRGEAAEEGHEPGERQLGIVRQRHRRVGEPSREQDEAQGEELPGVREVEGGRHDDLRQPARLLVAGTEPAEQRAAGLHEARQHDEQVAGDERGDERVARLAENIPGSNRGERGDQSREHPQADQQRHRDVRHEVDLQTAPTAPGSASPPRWPQSQTVHRESGE